MFKESIMYIRSLFNTEDFIPLHEPVFIGNEKKYLADCIDSTFVSSVGEYVDKFESSVADFTGAKFAIATTNGTAALHTALQLSGVGNNCEVITQPLTFIATCNAISYCGAIPVFVDVDLNTLGMCPKSLLQFLEKHTVQKEGKCVNKISKRNITAVVPMHTFGHPCQIGEIRNICNKYNIALIEDAAESLGSYFDGKHTGTFGDFGILSFNGNKTITTGGGGMLLTNNEELAKKAKHITTTAKISHAYEYAHDEIGFNYRLPNINAALGCAQMESISKILVSKKELSIAYQDFFNASDIGFVSEPENCNSNYWLNGLVLNNKDDRDVFLKEANQSGVMARPVWQLINKLKIYDRCHCENLDNSEWLADRIVNIPSSARI